MDDFSFNSRLQYILVHSECNSSIKIQTLFFEKLNISWNKQKKKYFS